VRNSVFDKFLTNKEISRMLYNARNSAIPSNPNPEDNKVFSNNDEEDSKDSDFETN